MQFIDLNLWLLLSLASVACFSDWSQDMDPNKWNSYARDKLDAIINQKRNRNVAKNVILFIGDGMGITTVTGVFSYIF